MQQPLITLTTDFGTVDGYVAAVKGVLLSRLPGVQLVDLSHDLPPGDIAAAASLLGRSVPSFPPAAVHLVVVDPGVGGSRRIVAVEHRQGRFVAPDNGVLDPFLDDGKVVAVDRPDLYLPGPGHTFHGRDRMAPVAAALAGGAAVSDLGHRHARPERLPVLRLHRSSDAISGMVVQIDRFGNLITNIPWQWVEELAGKACVWLGDQPVCRRVTHYAELPDGKPGFLCGSEATLEVAMNGRSLGREWHIQRGAGVLVQVGGRPQIDASAD